MSKQNDIYIAKLETIAETTQNADVQVLARTMMAYLKKHDQEHTKSESREVGFDTTSKG